MRIPEDFLIFCCFLHSKASRCSHPMIIRSNLSILVSLYKEVFPGNFFAGSLELFVEFLHEIVIQKHPRPGTHNKIKPQNWWGSAKRDFTHPTATIAYNTCYCLFRKCSCTTVHGRVDHDNNMTPVNYLMHGSITRKSQ